MDILEAPYEKNKISKLKVGDMVYISGKIFTARDSVCQYIAGGGKLPVSLKDELIYFCGPIVVKEKGNYVVKSAGPTTASRMDFYADYLVNKLEIRGVIGKGNISDEVAKLFKNSDVVFFNTVGGAGALLAKAIKKVHNVYFLRDFGPTEAIWELEVEKFPVFVTVDTDAGNIFKGVIKNSIKKYEIFEKSLQEGKT